MDEELMEQVLLEEAELQDVVEEVEAVVESTQEILIQNPVNVISSATGEAVEQTKHILHLDELASYFTWGTLAKLIVSIFTILIFYLAYRIIKRLVSNRSMVKFKAETTMLLNRGITYAFWIIMAMYIMGLFGVDFTAIWGAAGIAGIAIGFAAQTSVSNIISGLFVLGEKTLKIGDYICVDEISGNVDTIGLLSVKVRTLDNQVVRIPNSKIIDSNLTNYSSLPIRRFVFEIPIDYNADLQQALDVIKTVPSRCSCVLEEPAPKVFYDGFGDAIIMKMAVWFNSSDLIETKNQVYVNIVNACRENNVVIPYTHYDIKILEDDK